MKDAPKKGETPAKGGCGCHKKPAAPAAGKCEKPAAKPADQRPKR